MKTTSIVFPFVALLPIALATVSRADGDDEKKPYEIKIEQVKPQPAMTIRFRAAPEALAEKYGEAFGAIFGYVMTNGGQLAGPPFGRYHSMTDGKFDIEAGLPVAKALAEKGDIKASSLPGGTVATTVHVGPYEKLGEAHEALQSWARKNGKKATGGVWEYYLTDPGQEPDKNKYQTKLFLPIEAE
jgi:effector-binding domain-containing protein